MKRYFPSGERILFAEHLSYAGQVKQSQLRLAGEAYEPIRKYLCDALKASGVRRKDIQKATGCFMDSHWFGASQWRLPSEHHYKTLQELFGGALYKSYTVLYKEYQLLSKSKEKLDSQWLRSFSMNDGPHTDVWHFPASPGVSSSYRHPCEKPQALLKHILDISTSEGDLVLDCFAGGASIAVACRDKQRTFLGCEIGLDEFDGAESRLKC